MRRRRRRRRRRRGKEEEKEGVQEREKSERGRRDRHRLPLSCSLSPLGNLCLLYVSGGVALESENAAAGEWDREKRNRRRMTRRAELSLWR